jgi:hypothetical protein
MAIALVVLSASCNSTPRTAPELAQEFVLPLHETAAVKDTPLRIRFAEVSEDSRCPSNVVCVWQGNGRIRLEVVANGAQESVLLNTVGGGQFPQEASAFGYRLRLLELAPYPREPRPSETAYIAKLVVTPM